MKRVYFDNFVSKVAVAPWGRTHDNLKKSTKIAVPSTKAGRQVYPYRKSIGSPAEIETFRARTAETRTVDKYKSTKCQFLRAFSFWIYTESAYPNTK